jgi:pyridoxine 5-phosphate synthase
MIALSINLNKIALIRNSREGNYPDVLEHAHKCVAAGADGITVHPRPDQRHIRAADAITLGDALSVELNIEGNPFAGPTASNRQDVEDYPGFMELVRMVKPDQCTLVPDSDAQLTSDHGFDLSCQGDAVAPLIRELKSLGIRVSLFMDPDPEQIKRAAEIGADRIELYTGPYAERFRLDQDIDRCFDGYCRAAEQALESGLGINAGHDLNLDNLTRFATLPGLQEVSIGHAFTVDAIEMGINRAVAAYQQCLGKPLP